MARGKKTRARKISTKGKTLKSNNLPEKKEQIAENPISNSISNTEIIKSNIQNHETSISSTTPNEMSCLLGEGNSAEIKILNNIFKSASASVFNDITYLCSILKDHTGTNTDQDKKLKEININLQHNFKNFNLAFSGIQNTFNNFLKEHNVQTRKMNANTVSENLINSKNTQTEATPTHFENKSINTETSINNLTAIAVQTETFATHKEDKSNITNSLHNSNIVEPKFVKIKFEEVPKIVQKEDIIAVIQSITNEPLSSIKFIRRCKLSHVDKMNYIFRVNEKTAFQLISCEKITVKSFELHINYFIDIIRCFVCQRLGHYSNFCVNSITCANCGRIHKSTNCQQAPFCVNCWYNNNHRHTQFNFKHPSYSKNCKSIQLYIKQKIQILKAIHQ